MRKLLLASIAAISFAGVANAQTPNWPTTNKAAKEFVANMPADAWIKVMQQSLSLQWFVGKPIVAVVNATDETLVTVICDGKWTLVGSDPYIKGAPASVPARTVGFMPTDGFDNYCKQSIVGLTEGGERHNGVLSIPGDFTHSVSVVFR